MASLTKTFYANVMRVFDIPPGQEHDFKKCLNKFYRLRSPGSFDDLLDFVKDAPNLLTNSCTPSFKSTQAIRGGNGAVYVTPKFVLKFPLNKADTAVPGCFGALSCRGTMNFMSEQLLAVMFKSYELIIRENLRLISPTITFIPCFVTILEVLKTSRSDTVCAKLERLQDGDLDKYLFRNAGQLNVCLYMLLQVIHVLFILQEAILFMHRDMHGGNMMIRKNPDYKKGTLITLFSGLKIPSQPYIPVIIDCGYACAKLGSSFVSGGTALIDYNRTVGKDQCVLREFYDLRMFFFDLHYHDQHAKRLPPRLSSFIDRLFAGYGRLDKEFVYENINHSNNWKFTPTNLLNLIKLEFLDSGGGSAKMKQYHPMPTPSLTSIAENDIDIDGDGDGDDDIDGDGDGDGDIDIDDEPQYAPPAPKRGGGRLAFLGR